MTSSVFVIVILFVAVLVVLVVALLFSVNSLILDNIDTCIRVASH